MNGILRFSGAVKQDPAIDAWLRGRPDDLRPLAAQWFAEIRQCGDDVRKLMHDGYATACVKDAPFAYVGASRDHVNVGFFHGAAPGGPRGSFGRKRQTHAPREIEARPRDQRRRVERADQCLRGYQSAAARVIAEVTLRHVPRYSHLRAARAHTRRDPLPGRVCCAASRLGRRRRWSTTLAAGRSAFRTDGSCLSRIRCPIGSSPARCIVANRWLIDAYGSPPRAEMAGFHQRRADAACCGRPYEGDPNRE